MTGAGQGPAAQVDRPPPAGLQPPSLWGTEAHLRELFGDRASAIALTPRLFRFRYRSPAHFVEVFRTWNGPVHKAFAALPGDKAAALEQDLTGLLEEMNVAGPAPWWCRARMWRR